MLFKAVFCISSYLIFVLAKDINCSPFKFLFFLSIATCPDTLVWIVGDVEPGMQTRFGLHYIFKSSRSSHTRAYYIPAYQPHLAKPTLPRMGLNQIPTGILIRARLLKLKAGGIPGFIIKRSAGSRRGSVGSSCWRITVRIGFLGHKTKLYKLPPDRIIQVVTSQNWTTGHIYATLG